MSDNTTDAAATRRGRIMATALFIGALVMAYGASQIDYKFSSDPLGPRFTPYLLSLLLGLTSLWYFATPGGSETPPDGPGVRNLLGFMALSVLMIALMPTLGFITTMAILAAGIAFMFNATPLMAVVSGILQSILWWWVFGPVIGGTLPKGPFGF
jgi:putative tricarboxylic transport membrane protein